MDDPFGEAGNRRRQFGFKRFVFAAHEQSYAFVIPGCEKKAVTSYPPNHLEFLDLPECRNLIALELHNAYGFFYGSIQRTQSK